MTRIRLLFYGTILLLATAGCQHNGAFEEYKTIPSAGWHKDSTMVFDFTIAETQNLQNIYLNVRNHVTYSYSNLWLFIEITGPDGETQKDTFEVILADPAGKWMGKGFSGLKNQQVPYRNRISFPKPGNYRVSVKQGMREEWLKGISDLGIRVEKVN